MFYFVQKPKNVADPYEDLRLWEIVETSDTALAETFRSGWTTNSLGEMVPLVWHYDEFGSRKEAEQHIDSETVRILKWKGWLDEEGEFVDVDEE